MLFATKCICVSTAHCRSPSNSYESKVVGFDDVVFHLTRIIDEWKLPSIWPLVDCAGPNCPLRDEKLDIGRPFTHAARDMGIGTRSVVKVANDVWREKVEDERVAVARMRKKLEEQVKIEEEGERTILFRSLAEAAVGNTALNRPASLRFPRLVSRWLLKRGAASSMQRKKEQVLRRRLLMQGWGWDGQAGKMPERKRETAVI